MTVSVRYIVDDIEPAIDFYRDHLGFTLQMQPGPGFAMLGRRELRLLLNTPGGGGGAGEAMPDGSMPRPGGWSRFQVETDDIDAIIKPMKAAGVRFRNELVAGRGGRQILVEDPSGNLVELFEPRDGG